MNNLKRLRRRYELSVRELATRCGIGFSYISKLETGEVQFTMKTLSKLSSYFGTSSDYILGKSEVGFFVSFKDKGKQYYTTISENDLDEYIDDGWITEYASQDKVMRFVSNDIVIPKLAKQFEVNENGELIESEEKAPYQRIDIMDKEVLLDYLRLTKSQKELVKNLIKGLLKGNKNNG